MRMRETNNYWAGSCNRVDHACTEEVRQEVTSIVILHCSGLLRVVECSKVDAGVEAGGSLLSTHPFLLRF